MYTAPLGLLVILIEVKLVILNWDFIKYAYVQLPVDLLLWRL